MNSVFNKMFKLVTMTLIVSLANILALASVTSAGPAVGVLDSANSKAVYVNGNLAGGGMTILSGSELRTGKGLTSVNLGSLGQIDLGEDTSAVLTFSDANIRLNVLSGQGKLTAYKGVSGVLNTADGQSLQTDSSMAVSTVDSADTAAPSQNKRRGLSSGGVAALIVGGVVATVVIILVATNDDDNISPVR